MIRNRVQLASCIAVAYILVALGGTFLHYLTTKDIYTLKFSLMLPGTWIATVISGLVAWGLWQHFRWAWWLGFIAVVFQLLRVSSRLFHHFAMGQLPGFGVFLVFSLLALFLIILVLPSTRTVCSR